MFSTNHLCNGKIIQIAYECGPTGFELARVLKEAGYNVVVAPKGKR